VSLTCTLGIAIGNERSAFSKREKDSETSLARQRIEVLNSNSKDEWSKGRFIREQKLITIKKSLSNQRLLCLGTIANYFLMSTGVPIGI
jgi:hypothetical protein